MEMGLFDTLAMVPLWVGQTEESFLEEWAMSCQRLGLTMHIGRLQTHSFSFQKAKAIFWKPWVSLTPAMPSSPHL